jgi:hypothetical protein
MNARANLPMPRATVEQIVESRDEALTLYERAYAAIAAADEAIQAAHEMARRAAPIERNNYTYDRIDEISRFYAAVRLPKRDEFLRVARQLTDLQCWGYIVKMTDLERLMDVQAKEQLRNQLRYVPDRVDRSGQLITDDEAAKGMPPITVENIYATLEAFRMDADTIFRRGIANAFASLDRRFKSHDGFKVGSRIIVTRMFNEYGRLEWGSVRDTLIDVERVFAILDGHHEATFQSTLNMLEAERGMGHARQTLNENDYFRVRGFKNGNAHLWFKRDDLVRKVNKLLAEFYGEVIADGGQTEEDVFSNRKTTPAKRFGFFPTPDAAAKELFRNIWVLRSADQPRLRVLEPSAGTGNLARRCISKLSDIEPWRREEYARSYRFDNAVDCIEVQPDLAARLEAEGIYNRVICTDFLSLKPSSFEPYDMVVMNPPFDMERDIDHVTHALEFLKPGGQLFAIMSAGTEFRETRKAVALRARVERHGGSFRDLPPGSFRESGTNVNTVVLTMQRANS